MTGISSLAKSTVLVLITGLVALNPTRIQAHIAGDELIPEPVVTSQQLILGKTTNIPATQTQQSVPASSKPTFVPTDNLVSQAWWQEKVKSQVTATRRRQYDACLFGDSISSGIGNTLGEGTFNFALGGMSTVSLIEQLNILTSAKVKCNAAIIAMGTNDAEYGIANDKFVKNLKDSIALVKGLGATSVFLIPAFYSTVEASHNPRQAGSIARVEEVSSLIRQVAANENVGIFEQDIQSLYEGQALRKDMTTDGVHLNAKGKKIYRQALLKLLHSIR
ncbi:MAG: SGNH/GDSL hydrolase family protein [Aphanothece sp. CMT-3BRIN-NPC111]|jgi:hypothetical protein|nr:SGNH/GDSL hydrolase family protein [Aphanothece sp. CMT-3BRIN-NPC111]